MYLPTYLVWEVNTEVMEAGDHVVGESLQVRLIADIHLPGIGHGNCVQATPTMHAQGSGVHYLE